MATNTGYIIIEDTTDDVSKHPFSVAGKKPKGIIQRGILPKSIDTGVTTDLYCSTTASDIGGYYKLLTTNADTSTELSCTNTIPADTCMIASFATDAGVMDGIVTGEGVVTYRIRAKYSRSGLQPSFDPFIECFTYYRTAAGAESLILYNIWTVTLSYVNYTVDTGFTKSFAINSRLVVKLRWCAGALVEFL